MKKLATALNKHAIENRPEFNRLTTDNNGCQWFTNGRVVVTTRQDFSTDPITVQSEIPIGKGYEKTTFDKYPRVLQQPRTHICTVPKELYKLLKPFSKESELFLATDGIFATSEDIELDYCGVELDITITEQVYLNLPLIRALQPIDLYTTDNSKALAFRGSYAKTTEPVVGIIGTKTGKEYTPWL